MHMWNREREAARPERDRELAHTARPKTSVSYISENAHTAICTLDESFDAVCLPPCSTNRIVETHGAMYR